MDLFGEEKFKPLVRFGKVIPGFYVAKDGSGIIGKKGKVLSIWKNTMGYLVTTVTIKSDFFDDYKYKERTDIKSSTISLKVPIHRAVMETWKPIDENPPELLIDTWNDVPEQWRQWVRDTVLVDHIDANPHNNHMDNLRWEIPKDNEPNRKKQKLGL